MQPETALWKLSNNEGLKFAKPRHAGDGKLCFQASADAWRRIWRVLSALDSTRVAGRSSLTSHGAQSHLGILAIGPLHCSMVKLAQVNRTDQRRPKVSGTSTRRYDADARGSWSEASFSRMPYKCWIDKYRPMVKIVKKKSTKWYQRDTVST